MKNALYSYCSCKSLPFRIGVHLTIYFQICVVLVICFDRNHTLLAYTLEPNATYTVEFNTSVTLVCPIPTRYDYPAWAGPFPGSKFMEVYTFENISEFLRKQDRLSWAINKRDLIISPVKREDEGMYRCSGTGAGNWFSQILVRGKATISLIYVLIMVHLLLVSPVIVMSCCFFAYVHKPTNTQTDQQNKPFIITSKKYTMF